MSDKYFALIAAAGKGTRMNLERPKQLLKYKGTTILQHTASKFAENKLIDSVFILIPEDGSYKKKFESIADDLKHKYGKEVSCVYGGGSRGDSVRNGIQFVLKYCRQNNIDTDRAFVLIHDAARPEISKAIIERNIKSLKYNDAVCTVMPAIDSLRMTDSSIKKTFNDLSTYCNSHIINSKSLERDRVVIVQTPQSFKLNSIIAAYEFANAHGFFGTDDASVADYFGMNVALVEGDYTNNKITTGKDIPMGIRVGTGYDVHRLAEGHRLILCGVPLPSNKGLVGHSDADVATHALMDAILGAAARGDIGKYFPDTDEKYRGADSIGLLRETKKIAGNINVCNVDITIIAEKPKLAPYIEDMRNNIAEALEMPLTDINIKATTTEGLGFTGREEGIAAQAVCTIEGRF